MIMKKTNKILIIVIIAILVVTAGAAWWYLSNREEVPEDSIVLSTGGSEEIIDISKLKLTTFTGTTVNGKGDKKDIEAEGVKLSDIIGTSDYTEVSVISDDAYSANVKKEEMDQAYLQIEEGKARLYVFGDKDSKRNVKNVVRIEVK